MGHTLIISPPGMEAGGSDVRSHLKLQWVWGQLHTGCTLHASQMPERIHFTDKAGPCKPLHWVLLSLQSETPACSKAPPTFSAKPFWNPLTERPRGCSHGNSNPTRLTVKITHYTCLSPLSSCAAARTQNGPKRGCRSCGIMLRKNKQGRAQWKLQ